MKKEDGVRFNYWFNRSGSTILVCEALGVGPELLSNKECQNSESVNKLNQPPPPEAGMESPVSSGVPVGLSV